MRGGIGIGEFVAAIYVKLRKAKTIVRSFPRIADIVKDVSEANFRVLTNETPV